MKLQYSLKNGEKTYTLKQKVKIPATAETADNFLITKSAHYKFVKVRDAPKSK